MHRSPIPTLICLLGLVLMQAGPAARASTLSPGHPVWDSESLYQGELVQALLELRARQAKQPRAWRSHDPRSAKVFRSPARRFLILPVLYADGPEQGPVSTQEIASRFFDLHRGDSFANWWARASGGAFVPEGRVLPWMRLSGPRSQYYNVVDGRPRLAATRLMAEEAVCLAAPSLGQWWDYDDDGPDGIPGSGDDDGILDFVIVLHPNTGIEILVEDDGIVALQDRMDLDRVWQSCEVGADPFVVASVFDPLGVWVHESGHLLGLVDLYDLEVSADDTPEGRAVGGLGIWSLMATGTWGDEGRAPTDLDAYSRSLLGWNTVTPVSQTAELDLQPDAMRELVALAPAHDWQREGFLLEARSPTSQSGLDTALPGEGVLIYRVDASARDCRRPSVLRLVELMQADGRQDLEDLVNQGDAGDPYTGAPGADLFGPLTTPSSHPHEPGPGKLPPRVEIAATGQEIWSVQLQAAAVPALQLVEARFEDGEVSLQPGATQRWNPVFEIQGPVANLMRLRVASVGEGVIASTTAWIELESDGAGRYVLSSALSFEAPLGVTALDAELDLDLDLDGLLQRLPLGLPLNSLSGIAAHDFLAWNREIVAAGWPSTDFVPLASVALPAGSPNGWRLDTGTSAAYGNCAELRLVSPWIAPSDGAQDTLGFWSRVHTESSDPGEAWDGGVVELQWPGQAWRMIEPRGRASCLIVPLGSSPTAGEIGLGRGPQPWAQYQASYALLGMPYRVRFRFGSDGDLYPQDPQGGWALAGADVDAASSGSSLVLSSLAAGRMQAWFQTTNPSLASVSLFWRRAPSSQWIPLASEQALDASGSTQFEFDAPSAPYFEIGAFEGGLAQILLAREGVRASSGAGLIAFPNPSPGVVNFEAEISNQDRTLSIYNLQGRLVRQLGFPAQLSLVPWDGRDDAGHLVSSGAYAARLDDPGEANVSFVIVR